VNTKKSAVTDEVCQGKFLDFSHEYKRLHITGFILFTAKYGDHVSL